MERRNCTALITGASSGIGAATAKKFAREGYDLLLMGRNETRLKALQTGLTFTSSEILVCDLRELSSHVDELEKKLSGLAAPTVLVNNAGIFNTGSIESTSDAVWMQQFEVNLLSAVQLTRFLWPVFKKNHQGSIVNVSSTLGVKPTATTGAYSAVKAAMINWTQALALEGGTDNIRANCICPGIIDTPIHSFHSLQPEQKQTAVAPFLEQQLLRQLGTPEDIAEAIYFLASEQSRWTTGITLHVDGGINLT